MKLSQFIACFLYWVAIADAQTTSSPSNFLDVAWGVTPEDVKRVMATKPDSRPDPSEMSVGRLAYAGGTIAGQVVHVFAFEFAGGKFYRGAAGLKPVPDTDKQYREVRAQLVAKYGPPTTSRHQGKLAQSFWRFPPTAFNKEVITITCEMLSGPPAPMVRIIYLNETVKQTAGTTGNKL